MFGYVVINKPELKIKDFEKYQQYYCGLCQSLKNTHGKKSQLTLNNDLTFVGVLLTGLYEPKETTKKIRCPLHPIHAKIVRSNTCLDYASDMTIVLTYYKLDDDIQDENSLKSKVFQTILHKQFEQVKNKYPQKVKKILDQLEKIHQLEKENCTDLDMISGCFGHVMGEIMVYQDDIFKDDLYNMGYYLGKFIYLIDAFEDIEEDIHKNNYNPLKDKFKNNDFQEYCYHILEMMISKSSFYFEKLPIIENVDILKNIIYSGIWTKFELIKKKRSEEKR